MARRIPAGCARDRRYALIVSRAPRRRTAERGRDRRSRSWFLSRATASKAAEFGTSAADDIKPKRRFEKK